jgi:hypothetical protein
VICPTPKAKYFCKQDWTGKKSADELICPSGSGERFVADDDGRICGERRAFLASAEKWRTALFKLAPLFAGRGRR